MEGDRGRTEAGDAELTVIHEGGGTAGQHPLQAQACGVATNTNADGVRQTRLDGWRAPDGGWKATVRRLTATRAGPGGRSSMQQNKRNGLRTSLMRRPTPRFGRAGAPFRGPARHMQQIRVDDTPAPRQLRRGNKTKATAPTLSVALGKGTGGSGVWGGGGGSQGGTDGRSRWASPRPRGFALWAASEPSAPKEIGHYYVHRGFGLWAAPPTPTRASGARGLPRRWRRRVWAHGTAVWTHRTAAPGQTPPRADAHVPPGALRGHCPSRQRVAAWERPMGLGCAVVGLMLRDGSVVRTQHFLREHT